MDKISQTNLPKLRQWWRNREIVCRWASHFILDLSRIAMEVIHAILDHGLMTTEVCCTSLSILLQKRVIFCSHGCISWFTLALFREKWIKPIMNKSNFKITLLIITAATYEILSEVCQSNIYKVQYKTYSTHTRHCHFESQSIVVFGNSGILAKSGQPKTVE